MVEMKQSANNAQQTITNEQLEIILDALLHEIERHNQAEELVTEKNARAAIVAAKHLVFDTHKKLCSLLYDPEL